MPTRAVPRLILQSVWSSWQNLISEAIATGGSLFDKGFQDLCWVLYVSLFCIETQIEPCVPNWRDMSRSHRRV